MRKSNLNILNEDSLSSYYWAGFIAADGCVRKRKSKILLKIKLSQKDLKHLKKYKCYINSTNKINKSVIVSHKIGNRIIGSSKVCSLESGDTEALKVFIKKFDLKPNKTYNPPKFKFYSKLKKQYLLAFLIGMIDGDGTIKKRKDRVNGLSITLRCHQSWILFFKRLCKSLNSLLRTNIKPFKVKNSNLVGFSIYQKKTISELQSLIKLENLPILERKWGKL